MNKHKTLNDTIFKNSKYMNVVNSITNCNFRKEHKEKYNFMLDTFSTFILLYNCFYSDSNLSKNDKIENAISIIEEYLYLNLDENENKKYSVRFIQNIPEKHSTHIYRRINEWYEILVIPDNNINLVLEEIKKEMELLEKVSFDDILKDNINYKKNKDSNHKIYLCKFNFLYSNYEEFINEFVNEYKDNHITPLSDEELSNISLIYTLIAKCCNAITIGLENKHIEEYNITERITPTELFNIYLKTLDININSYSFRMDATQFMLEYMMNYKEVMLRGISINEMMNNYDYYFFMTNMLKVINDKDFIITDEQIRKDLEDLKNIYKILHTPPKDVEDTLNNLSIAFNLIQKLMNKKRIQDYFIRVS